MNKKYLWPIIGFALSEVFWLVGGQPWIAEACGIACVSLLAYSVATAKRA